MKTLKYSNVIDKILRELNNPFRNDVLATDATSAIDKAKESLATELVRMMEEALEEVKTIEEYDILNSNTHEPLRSQIHSENVGYIRAVDQTRTRLAAIIERELS